MITHNSRDIPSTYAQGEEEDIIAYAQSEDILH